MAALDAPDPEYGTRMARLLHDAQAHGILTSVDVVSEVGERYRMIVPPALRYTDYFIVNEIEAGKTVGVNLRGASDELLIDRIPEVLMKLKALGVRRWAVIHAPEGGFGIDEAGNYVEVPSLLLPKGVIVGTVGAGDAFCAGALLGAHNGRRSVRRLRTASPPPRVRSAPRARRRAWFRFRRRAHWPRRSRARR